MVLLTVVSGGGEIISLSSSLTGENTLLSNAPINVIEIVTMAPIIILSRLTTDL